MKYIDLGLPSGTKWASRNYGAKKVTESGDFYTFEEANNLNLQLPSNEQFIELLKNTKSRWVENYRNSGVNGNLFISLINKKRLFIPASGSYSFSIYDGNGHFGGVWGSESYTNSYGYKRGYYIVFSAESLDIAHNNTLIGRNIRIVKN